MEQEETPKTSRILLVIIGAVSVMLIVGIVWLVIAIKNVPPVPSAILGKANFTVYYPEGNLDNIHIDPKSIRYDENANIIQMTATTPAQHRITISEQALPNTLTFDRLKGQGAVIKDVPGQAAISNVEGRIVASMITSDNKALILLNSTDASSDELTTLLKNMRAQH
jgi:hypothetical protein